MIEVIFILIGVLALLTLYFLSKLHVRIFNLETNPLSSYQRVLILEGKVYKIEDHSLTHIERRLSEVEEALFQRHMLSKIGKTQEESN